MPSSASSYFSYGDTLLDNANVFGVLPASPARSFAVSLKSSGLLCISQCCSIVHGCAASYTSGIRCCLMMLLFAYVLPISLFRYKPAPTAVHWLLVLHQASEQEGSGLLMCSAALLACP